MLCCSFKAAGLQRDNDGYEHIKMNKKKWIIEIVNNENVLLRRSWRLVWND